MREEKCRVISNINIQGNYFLLKVESENVYRNGKPGNFVMIAASGNNDPLLKRPFGIFKSEPGCFYIYYEVVGKGSRLLATKKNGDTIVVLGPLGNTFPKFEKKKILLIGGGRGIAPLFFVASKYCVKNEISLVYGAGSKADLLFTEELSEFKFKEALFYTDDGSGFNKGTVVSEILEVIERNKIEITFSCGPDKMLEALNLEIGNYGLENYVSMESFMGCGFGICHSCVVMGSDGKYRKVCTDGPVFRMEDVKW